MIWKDGVRWAETKGKNTNKVGESFPDMSGTGKIKFPGGGTKAKQLNQTAAESLNQTDQRDVSRLNNP